MPYKTKAMKAMFGLCASVTFFSTISFAPLVATFA
jgi:hypothetical protein